MNKFKVFITICLIGITALLFQNFDAPNLLLQLDPNTGSINRSSTRWDFIDHRNKKHEVKLGGGGLVPRIFYYPRYKQDFFWFESAGNNDITESDRSEIRMVGSDSYFDQVYYTSFQVYYPSWAAAIDRTEWALLWQCAQPLPSGEAPRSPPLSIHFSQNRLALTSITDLNKHKRKKWSQTHLAPFPRNKWVKVFMRFSLGEYGHFKVWINNKVVAEERKPIGYTNGANPLNKIRGCTTRFGIYKAGNPGRVALLFSDVRIGTDYDFVKGNPIIKTAK